MIIWKRVNDVINSSIRINGQFGERERIEQGDFENDVDEHEVVPNKNVKIIPNKNVHSCLEN